MVSTNYIDLFIAILTAVEATAEKAMEYDKKENNLQAYKTAKQMREEYSALKDNLHDKRENYVFTAKDCATIFTGAFIVSEQLRKKINQEQAVLEGYKTDIMPKLEQAVKAGEKVNEKMVELFQVK